MVKCIQCKKPLSSGKLCDACMQKDVDIAKKGLGIGVTVIAVVKFAPKVIKKIPSIIKMLR